MPEKPNVKDKIMFWKAYRGYVKHEINRLRQVSILQLKIAFIKGKFQIIMCKSYLKNATNIIIN